MKLNGKVVAFSKGMCNVSDRRSLEASDWEGIRRHGRVPNEENGSEKQNHRWGRERTDVEVWASDLRAIILWIKRITISQANFGIKSHSGRSGSFQDDGAMVK
jgi:hypothetical protein